MDLLNYSSKIIIYENCIKTPFQNLLPKSTSCVETKKSKKTETNQKPDDKYSILGISSNKENLDENDDTNSNVKLTKRLENLELKLSKFIGSILLLTKQIITAAELGVYELVESGKVKLIQLDQLNDPDSVPLIETLHLKLLEDSFNNILKKVRTIAEGKNNTPDDGMVSLFKLLKKTSKYFKHSVICTLKFLSKICVITLSKIPRHNLEIDSKFAYQTSLEEYLEKTFDTIEEEVKVTFLNFCSSPCNEDTKFKFKFD